MSDDDRKRVTPAPTYLPALSSAHTPRPTVPSLPSSSGAFLGTRTRIMRKDAEFVRQHADLLAARRSQTNNFTALVEARLALAMKLAELATLPEMVEHQYLKGQRDRGHELRMLDIAHQTAETHAKIGLAAVQQQLAQYLPRPEAPAAPQPATAPTLTPADVEKVARALPELKPETIQTLLFALGGLMAEKNK